ncbi:MAG TPA: porin family protein [Bacteroidales bacterium]|nr:porin family protein [Bacteroidales bacterium]
MQKTILIILVIIVTPYFVKGQDFYAGAKGGLVLSQIDGDNFGGYHKFAGLGGVYVRNNMGETWGYRMEMYYIQKGSHRFDPIPYYKAKLNYIEIPFLFTYKMERLKIPPSIDWFFDRKLHLHAGISLGYLFKATEDNGYGPNEATFAFRRIEIAGQAGLNYYFSPHWAIDFRMSYTMLPIRGMPTVSDIYYWWRFQCNRVLSFGLVYEL